MQWEVQPFLDWVDESFEPSVRVEPTPGAYAAARGGNEVDLYGSSDMACVRYTTGARPDDEMPPWAEVIQSFQDPITGHFVERGRPTHVELHASAYAVAALRLLDATPTHTLTFLRKWDEPEAVRAFVAGLDWRDWVYLESHAGAGVGSLAVNSSPRRDAAWFDAYFDALDAVLDPVTGMHGVNKPATGDTDQIGGTFHYAFLYEFEGRPLAFAPARIDAVLGLQNGDGIWDPDNPLWLTLDAVYLLRQAVRNSDHRRAGVERAVTSAVEWLHDNVLAPERREAAFGGPMATHDLVAVLTTLTEAQRLLGRDAVRTARPLSSVLDQRPFV
jgi:hypothetical protein